MTERRGIPIILDSNFLFIPLQFTIDIFDELRRLLGGLVRCIVPTLIIEELERLKQGATPSMVKEIDFALNIAEQCEIVDEKVYSWEKVDDAVIRIAQRYRCAVATNDSELRGRLRAEGIPVIYLRQRSHLEIEGTTSFSALT